MPKKKNGPNKSAFIRSQPASLSATEVVANAKAAGMTISPTLVYVVRGKQKARRAGARKASSNGAAPSAKATGNKMSASDFIRSQPLTMTAPAVVKAGAGQGLSFSAPLVYMARKRMKKGGPKAAKAGRAKGSPVRAAKAAGAGLTGHHAEFRRLMIHLGLEQAEAIYAVVYKELKAL